MGKKIQKTKEIGVAMAEASEFATTEPEPPRRKRGRPRKLIGGGKIDEQQGDAVAAETQSNKEEEEEEAGDDEQEREQEQAKSKPIPKNRARRKTKPRKSS